MTTMMDAALLLRDPPTLKQDKGLVPLKEFPGRPSNLEDVANACRPGRDWFRYWHRADRHIVAWQRFYEGWERRQGRGLYYPKSWDWDQRVLTGIYGGGKSSIAVASAEPDFEQGIPVFHNGPCLFGWVVEGDRLFTLMRYICAVSRIVFDEAHGVLPGSRGATTAVGVGKALGANIRKFYCKWDLVSRPVGGRPRQDTGGLQLGNRGSEDRRAPYASARYARLGQPGQLRHRLVPVGRLPPQGRRGPCRGPGGPPRPTGPCSWARTPARPSP